ncbi:MAG: hypothetical protein HY775_09535 [Acidobacteria bacterium]|nr:hypothetical protein [Acidobacteriota bacterium]
MVTSTIEVDAFLADSVVAAEGKLFVQGLGWNIINAQRTPTRHDRIGVGILIRVPYTATNQPHKFELRLENADGIRLSIGDNPMGQGKIQGLGGEFNVGRPPTINPGDEQIVPFAVNINNLPFEQAGSYRFVVSVDGVDGKELPFRVQLVGQPQPIIRAAGE